MFRIAETVAPERRLLVLLAGQTGMRRGELLALRRRHVDLLHGTIRVEESALELKTDAGATKAPKSDAGRRTIHLAPTLRAEVERHLGEHVETRSDAHLFTGPKGGRLRSATWHQEWTEAREATGLTHLHFHDLRHLAGTSFAQAGATTKETMRRLGHSTPAAALRYQHATDERDKALADEQERRMASAISAAN